jgi:hypothetical protein
MLENGDLKAEIHRDEGDEGDGGECWGKRKGGGRGKGKTES